MKRTFRYRPDKRARRITWCVIILVAMAAGGMVYAWFGTGAYFSAWFISMAVAVAALYILSIPRKIYVSDEALEIHCVVELTSIELEDIHSIQRCDNQDTGLILLIGSYGFFGYYGYFLDRRKWEIVKVYASEWNNLVEIEDVYEQRYIVSCSDPAALISSVNTARERVAGRHK